MFWDRKKPDENVPKTFESRIVSIERRLGEIESQILAITIDQKMVRDKVLRKIQFKHTEEEEQQPDPYKSVLIPDRRY